MFHLEWIYLNRMAHYLEPKWTLLKGPFSDCFQCTLVTFYQNAWLCKNISIKFGKPMHDCQHSIFCSGEISENMKEAVPFEWLQPQFLVGLRPPGSQVVGTCHCMRAQIFESMHPWDYRSKLVLCLCKRMHILSSAGFAEVSWSRTSLGWTLWQSSPFPPKKFLGAFWWMNSNEIFYSVTVVGDSFPGHHELNTT